MAFLSQTPDEIKNKTKKLLQIIEEEHNEATEHGLSGRDNSVQSLSDTNNRIISPIERLQQMLTESKTKFGESLDSAVLLVDKVGGERVNCRVDSIETRKIAGDVLAVSGFFDGKESRENKGNAPKEVCDEKYDGYKAAKGHLKSGKSECYGKSKGNEYARVLEQVRCSATKGVLIGTPSARQNVAKNFEGKNCMPSVRRNASHNADAETKPLHSKGTFFGLFGIF